MNITSELTNLPLFEANKQCIVYFRSELGYWWGTIVDIKIANNNLQLKIEFDKGPFSMKGNKPVYSSESLPYYGNPEIFPDLPIVRELISRIISLNKEIEKRSIDNTSYKRLYDNVIDKLTGNTKI